MKFSLIFLHIICIAFNLSMSFRIKTHSKVHSNNLFNSKLSANGPIDWTNRSFVQSPFMNSYNNDEVFTKQFFNQFNNNNNNKIVNPPRALNVVNKPKVLTVNNKARVQTNNRKNTSSNTILSQNQESASFRTVGPYVDSTSNKNGKKYKNVLNTDKSQRINPGYYGASRLTRY